MLPKTWKKEIVNRVNRSLKITGYIRNSIYLDQREKQAFRNDRWRHNY